LNLNTNYCASKRPTISVNKSVVKQHARKTKMHQLSLLKYGLPSAVHPDTLDRLIFHSHLVADKNSRKAIALK